jgi:hypothetical protein
MHHNLYSSSSSSSSLLTLQPCVGLGLLHGFGMGLQPHAQHQTWRKTGYTSSGPNPLTCLARVALPGAYTPTSIVLHVTG